MSNKMLMALDNLAKAVPYGSLVRSIDLNGDQFLDHVRQYIEALQESLESVYATSGPGSCCNDEGKIKRAWDVAREVIATRGEE